MHTKLLLSSMTVLMGLTFSIHSVSAHGFSPQVAPLSDSPSAEVHHPSSQPLLLHLILLLQFRRYYHNIWVSLTFGELLDPQPSIVRA